MLFSFPLCGFRLAFCLDGFRLLYAGIALFMWIVSLLFTPRYFRGHGHLGRYVFFTLLTFFSTIGVFLSDDLFCTFIFFEIMSFASYVWVAQEETPAALRAAGTYLAVAVFGGMVTLMGLFMLHHLAGTLSFSGLRTWAASLQDPSVLLAPALLAFTGFAAKAGVFPLHIWLPKAHPVAPAPASALLSGILTKSGVFGMIVLSCNLFPANAAWGSLLLALALPTMIIGALMAVFSTDLKHTLACSSMSQIGFILTGLAFTVLLGHENALAARGTLLHMVNHSLIKLDLFLCAGAVFMNTHTLNLTELRGFGRHKPFLHFCFLTGYLGLIGLPLFSGYLSKSLIHEAILEYAAEAGSAAWVFSLYEKLFLCAGGLTAAYMTKLYLCLFIFRNRDAAIQARFDQKKSYLSPASALALAMAALPPLLLGLLPDLLASPLLNAGVPFLGGGSLHGAIAWFSAENLSGAASSLGIGLLVCLLIHCFLVRQGAYLSRWPVWLDLENRLYRPLVVRILPALGGFVAGCCNRFVENPLLMKLLPNAVTACTRACEHIVDNPLLTNRVPKAVTACTRALENAPDALVVGLRHSMLRKEKESDHSLTLGDQWLLASGDRQNRFEAFLNRFRPQSAKKPTDHVARLFSIQKEARRLDFRYSRSFSFGLLMLSIGLCAVLIYLLTI